MEYDMPGLSKESSVTILMVSAVRTDVVFSAFAETESNIGPESQMASCLEVPGGYMAVMEGRRVG